MNYRTAVSVFRTVQIMNIQYFVPTIAKYIPDAIINDDDDDLVRKYMGNRKGTKRNIGKRKEGKRCLRYG